MMKIISHSVTETLNIGKKVSRHLRPGDILCFYGQLGSGKTVLTKGVAKGLGIDINKVISPTFVLIREHTNGKLPLYHFDLYRLEDSRGILELGYEEYFYGDGVSVIEWADRLKSLTPKEFLRVDLSIIKDSQREIKLSAIGSRYEELLGEIDENIGD